MYTCNWYLLCFCFLFLQIGINPGLFASYKGHHYAGPGNHFCEYTKILFFHHLHACSVSYLFVFTRYCVSLFFFILFLSCCYTDNSSSFRLLNYATMWLDVTLCWPFCGNMFFFFRQRNWDQTLIFNSNDFVRHIEQSKIEIYFDSIVKFRAHKFLYYKILFFSQFSDTFWGFCDY